MDGYTWPEAWRYSLGVAPTHFLKVVQKLLSLEKPVRKQTSLMEVAGSLFNRNLAAFMRMAMRYSWGVKPVSFLNSRVKMEKGNTQKG